ncbi:MAG: sulfatase family protein, partial [Planctomycetaceae bacterium]
MRRSLTPFLLFVLAVPALAADESAPKPNLVAIVTDDQARWAMGAYGNAEIRTPNMDRIGREGALFMNAFVVTPVCSPSRAAYMSGRWPTEVGITDYLSPQESDAGIGLSAPIWPEVLQQNGYRTALLGKWHLGTKPQFHPKRKGFDHFFGFVGGGNRPIDPLLEVDGQETQLEGPLPDLLVDDAIGFIRRSQRDKTPFLLCLHFRAPHTPYLPVPEQDSAPYADLDPTVPLEPGVVPEEIKDSHRAYYASVTSVDRNIGRLLDA